MRNTPNFPKSALYSDVVKGKPEKFEEQGFVSGLSTPSKDAEVFGDTLSKTDANPTPMYSDILKRKRKICKNGFHDVKRDRKAQNVCCWH